MFERATPVSANDKKLLVSAENQILIYAFALACSFTSGETEAKHASLALRALKDDCSPLGYYHLFSHIQPQPRAIRPHFSSIVCPVKLSE